MDNFSDKIKDLRKSRQITQKEFAKVLGVSPTCYAGYEQGYREPDFKTLKKICIILDVSADYLLGLEDETGAKNFGVQYNNSTHNGNNNF